MPRSRPIGWNVARGSRPGEQAWFATGKTLSANDRKRSMELSTRDLARLACVACGSEKPDGLSGLSSPPDPNGAQ